jgi:hypothetical protein
VYHLEVYYLPGAIVEDQRHLLLHHHAPGWIVLRLTKGYQTAQKERNRPYPSLPGSKEADRFLLWLKLKLEI